MLWNSVFEFYVKYIFGGILDGNYYSASLGNLIVNGNVTSSVVKTWYLNVFDFTDNYGATQSMSLGNYLSFIATLITMVIIVVLCCLFVKKIVSLVGGLIRQ